MQRGDAASGITADKNVFWINFELVGARCVLVQKTDGRFHVAHGLYGRVNDFDGIREAERNDWI